MLLSSLPPAGVILEACVKMELPSAFQSFLTSPLWKNSMRNKYVCYDWGVICYCSINLPVLTDTEHKDFFFNCVKVYPELSSNTP